MWQSTHYTEQSKAAEFMRVVREIDRKRQRQGDKNRNNSKEDMQRYRDGERKRERETYPTQF